MRIERIIASEYGAHLDSNVYTGKGTDDTEVLQKILDRADGENVGVHLVMDGAALIKGLKLRSNTTIECLSKDCGFYLADNSDCPVVKNADEIREGKVKQRNIRLIGGTYNQNCAHQIHSVKFDDDHGFFKNWGIPGFAPSCDYVVALRFVGVENLEIKDIVIRDQRTYAALFANWKNITIENTSIELPGRVHGQNQDGFHIFGPGQFLNMRNVRGCTSDDFIALAPDESDGKSSITDVLIDGVTLDDADQAIRMLVHHKGLLDRVLIRNVTGTYRSYGFFINPFFNTGVDENGGYGNITIENVNLRSTAIDYDYTEPFLFRVGGHMRSLTLRNIEHYHPVDHRYLVDLGLQYYMDDVKKNSPTVIDSLTVDGLHTAENSPLSRDTDYIRVKDCTVKNLTIRNVNIERTEEVGTGGNLLSLVDSATVENLSVSSVSAQKLSGFIKCDKNSTAENLTVNAVTIKK